MSHRGFVLSVSSLPFPVAGAVRWIDSQPSAAELEADHDEGMLHFEVVQHDSGQFFWHAFRRLGPLGDRQSVSLSVWW